MAIMNRQQMQAALREHGFDDMAFSAMDMADLGFEVRRTDQDSWYMAERVMVLNGQGDYVCKHCGSDDVSGYIEHGVCAETCEHCGAVAYTEPVYEDES